MTVFFIVSLEIPINGKQRRLSWGALLILGILLSSGKAIALGRFEKTQLEKVLTELVQDPFEQVTQTAHNILSKMK